jgi:hypothetical protein
LGYEPDVRLRKTTQSLATAGFDVRILAWDRAGSLPKHEREGPVAIERIRVRSRRGRGLTQLLFLAIVGVAMARRLRRHRPDVVHAVDLPMLLIAVLARPFVGRPKIVYDAFEIYSLMVAHRFPRPILAALGFLERQLPRSADLVITAGASRTRWFERLGVRSLAVPNWPEAAAGVSTVPAGDVEGDDDPDGDRAVARLAARRDLGVGPDSFCLAYTGALLASRDLESLLRFAHRHHDDTVLIAGLGDRGGWLGEAAKDMPNVRLLGWLPDPSGVLSAADAIYYALHTDHPYAAYAAPNNLYVAIAHAVPLVYRAQGELADVGNEHEIGRAFTDDASLDVAVAELRDPEVAARIRAALLNLRRAYTWEAAVSPLLAAYPRSERAMNRLNANGP